MSQELFTKSLLGRLNTPLVLGSIILALLAVTAVTLVWAIKGVLFPATMPAAAEVGPRSGDEMKSKLDTFKKQLASAGDRINTRSPFYPPKPKAVPAPPVPNRYAGPALIAMVNNSAMFADGTMLSVGDPSKNGISILEVNAPWTAKVRWNGGEFTVTLFERDPSKLTSASTFLPTPGITPITPIKPGEPVKPAAGTLPPGSPKSPAGPTSATPAATGQPVAVDLPNGMPMPAEGETIIVIGPNGDAVQITGPKPAEPPKPDAPKPDAPKPDETKPDEVKPADPKPADPKN